MNKENDSIIEPVNTPDEVELEFTNSETGKKIKKKFQPEDTSLYLRNMMGVELDVKPLWKHFPPERLINNIVLKELLRIFQAYKDNEDINHDDPVDKICECFQYAIASEINDERMEKTSSQKLKCDLRRNLLDAKSLDESMLIVEDARKKDINFRTEYVDSLLMATHLVKIEKNDCINNVIYAICLFYSIIEKNNSDKMKLLEQQIVALKKEKFFQRYSKNLRLFMKYLNQVENAWHPLKDKKTISKEKAIKTVFNKNKDNNDFLKKIKDAFDIDIRDESTNEYAIKEFSKLVDKYTKSWCLTNNNKTKNGYEIQKRQSRSLKSREKTSKAMKRSYAKRKKNNRRKRKYSSESSKA